jgi:hypothetical protein
MSSKSRTVELKGAAGVTTFVRAGSVKAIEPWKAPKGKRGKFSRIHLDDGRSLVVQEVPRAKVRALLEEPSPAPATPVAPPTRPLPFAEPVVDPAAPHGRMADGTPRAPSVE